jgi:hypothetical protein
MGLDMSLSRRTRVSDRSALKITGLKSKVNPARVTYIIEEAGYWRNANAIHEWFVDNVQGGNDDCRRYYVSPEQLKELLEAVETVLAASELVDGDVKTGERYEDGKRVPMMEKGRCIKDPSVAREVLPTQSGFFFGSTDYDQYYYDDLVLAKSILETAVADHDGSYYYESSW